jgi:hypothetical protein
VPGSAKSRHTKSPASIAFVPPVPYVPSFKEIAKVLPFKQNSARHKK